MDAFLLDAIYLNAVSLTSRRTRVHSNMACEEDESEIVITFRSFKKTCTTATPMA